MLLEQRQDVVAPHPVDVGIGANLRTHQVGGPDLEIATALAHLSVEFSEQFSSVVGDVVGRHPLLQDTPDRRLRRVQLDEGEAASNGRVHQRDRAVRGVHRSDDEEVWRQLEGLHRLVLQAYCLVAVLKQEVELTKDFRDVRTVHFVDDEDVGVVAILRVAGFCSEQSQRSVLQFEGWMPGLGLRRTVPLEEVLVGVGRVELHQPHAAGVCHKVLCDLLGEKRLAGARGAVEHDLLALLEQVDDLLQIRPIHVQ